MKRGVIAALAVLLLIGLHSSFSPLPVAACECPEWPTPQAALAKSDLAFTGKVVAVNPIPAGGDMVTFAVDAAWKAVTPAQVGVLGPPFCEFEFQVGLSYLVYAANLPSDAQAKLGFGPGRYLEPVPCNRTQILAGASADLVALGPGSPPRQAAPGLPTTGHSSDSGPIYVLLGSLLLLLGRRLHSLAAGVGHVVVAESRL